MFSDAELIFLQNDCLLYACGPTRDTEDVYIDTVLMGQCIQREPGDGTYGLGTFMHCRWVNACKLYIHSLHNTHQHIYSVPIDQHIYIIYKLMFA